MVIDTSTNDPMTSDEALGHVIIARHSLTKILSHAAFMRGDAKTALELIRGSMSTLNLAYIEFAKLAESERKAV